MGGFFSRSARRSSKQVETPSWAGKRTPAAGGARPPLASDVKTDSIKQDSEDPHFLSNLSRLGPVRVDHRLKSVRPGEDVTRIFQSRRQSEQEASSTEPTKNRLHAPTLAELLDKRKAVTSKQELQRLAQDYNIEVEVLENLARYVNSPSVDSSTVVKTVGKDGEESISMRAVWLEPRASQMKFMT